MMYVIDEQSDVFADAIASDDNAQLLFMSVFGRDTSIQQLLARCQLPRSQGGIDKLSFRLDPKENLGPRTTVLADAEVLEVLIGDPNRLDKLTGRLPKENLFGNLVHAWIFDPVILAPDRAGRTGWNLREFRDEQDANFDASHESLWSLVKEVSPLPLLDHWQEFMLTWLFDQGCIRQARTTGRIRATKVVLPEAFEVEVSRWVREGALALPEVSMTQQELAA